MADAPGPIFHPDQALLDRLDYLERRLDTLDRSRQLEHSSIKDGALTILDADGGERAKFGKLGGTLGHGIQVFSPDGSSHTFLVTDELGMAVPWQLIPMGSAGAARFTTSAGSLTEAFLADFAALAHELTWNIVVTPPSSGSMDVSATLAPIGGNEVTLDTRTYDTAAHDVWEFPEAIAEGDIGAAFRLRLKIKKNSGTGDASIGVVTHPVNRAPTS